MVFSPPALLDLAAARQLGLKPTGQAARGTSGPPSPTTSNFYLEKGKVTVAELISDIKSGLYITSLIGDGVDYVTGDYSRGASGFWIDKGQIAWPVSGITVAGNLKDHVPELDARQRPAIQEHRQRTDRENRGNDGRRVVIDSVP